MNTFNFLKEYKEVVEPLCKTLYPKLIPGSFHTEKAFYNHVSKELFTFFIGDSMQNSIQNYNPVTVTSVVKPANKSVAPAQSSKRARGPSVKPRNAWLHFYYSRNEELKNSGKVLALITYPYYLPLLLTLFYRLVLLV